jgi:hypothetical protein
VQQQDSDDGHADGGGELCRGVEDGSGQPAFLGREPETDGLGVCGKDWRLADAEQHARGEEGAKGRRHGGGEGGQAPEQGADAADDGDADCVQQGADRQLADGIGPVVCAGKIAECDLVDVECDLVDVERRTHRIMCNRQIHTIEKIDEYT